MKGDRDERRQRNEGRRQKDQGRKDADRRGEEGREFKEE